MLEGDVECPDIVVFIVYDTRPVNVFVYGSKEVGVEHQ